MKQTTIDLSKYDYLMVIALSGLLATPTISLGSGPDIYVSTVNDLKKGCGEDFYSAFSESFRSFGFDPSSDFLSSNPKVLIVPIQEASDLGVKNALTVSDVVLAIFNKKYFPAKARFLNWDRKRGTAIGAIRSKGSWKPIKMPGSFLGPAIVRSIDQDFWDWVISSYLRNTLTPLGEALIKSMLWERAADFSPNNTHRFAFMWIAMESMLPKDDYDKGSILRRYALLVNAPRSADSKMIMKDTLKQKILKQYENSNTKQWIKTIEEMYDYRCAILHDGQNDLVSTVIDPNKVDWFFHLARRLCILGQNLTISALMNKVTTVDDLWSQYALNFLYSEKSRLFENGMEINDLLIMHDWQKSPFPDFNT